MAIWTNAGTLVVDGSNKVITCATCPCGDFCDNNPTSIVVDLGAGGWVDEDCDYCDQVAGQFTLTRYYNANFSGSCESRYSYEECPVCEELCTDRHAGFRILVNITYTVATDQYDVFVEVEIEANDNATELCFSKSDGTPSSSSIALYDDSVIDGPPPLTVAQISNTHDAWGGGATCPGLQVCTGTLAATVEVSW